MLDYRGDGLDKLEVENMTGPGKYKQTPENNNPWPDDIPHFSEENNGYFDPILESFTMSREEYAEDEELLEQVKDEHTEEWKYLMRRIGRLR